MRRVMKYAVIHNFLNVARHFVCHTNDERMLYDFFVIRMINLIKRCTNALFYIYIRESSDFHTTSLLFWWYFIYKQLHGSQTLV